MNKNETEQHIKRIDRFERRLSSLILSASLPMKAEFSWSKDPVKFEDRLTGEFKPVTEGDTWGHTWESAWFHLEATIPDTWKNKMVVAQLDFAGEGLVYSGSGDIMQGITNGSVFDGEFNRDIVRLIDRAKGGEKIELWVEAAANGLFGMFTEPDPEPNSPNRYGHYDARVNAMKLCVFDWDLWKMWLDFRVLSGLIRTLPEKSVRKARIVRALNDAIDAFKDDTDRFEFSHEELLPELYKQAAPSDMKVTAVGHAHIDTAWLWPVCETIRKCARTFASQISLIEKYPDYVFGASQPQHYAFVKEHYPDLYEKVKKAVAEGRWEPQGGMWVEADCNLISGESMVRQILHGKNFFNDEFGVDVDNLWLPDVFGYSAAMPQILQKSGIKYFLTQKLSWSQYNEFPHHTFKWRGIDGSEVLTHFPPENTYNSQLGTDYLVPAQEHFKEKDYVDEFISLFGVGDGGGGPKEENIELGKRQANLEGSPRVQFGNAKDFFKRLTRYSHKLPTWVGELYLELHRGTLTTQGKVKKANRKLEHKLREIEILGSCLPLDKYPSAELDSIWKKVLINQFHDIIPGSSITKVYSVTHQEHEDALNECGNLTEKLSSELFTSDDDSIVLFNSTHTTYEGPITLPESWTNCGVENQNGQNLPSQIENGRLVAMVTIAPYSFVNLKKSIPTDTELQAPEELILENYLIRYQFDHDGNLIDAWDKELNRQILAPEERGNVLTLYEDRPNDWDAWEIDITYEKCALGTAQLEGSPECFHGPVRQGINFALTVGNSRITQTVTLPLNSKRLDFATEVDWKEKHRMLRVAFPVDIHTEHANFDIQYGYVKRSTHRNLSWDMAKFEVAAHRYADLSNNEFGVALLNDCKYGYKVHHNVIDLNLLRAPNYPDPDADQGKHTFTYSLLPHTGDLIHSGVIAEAAHLNQGILLFENRQANEIKLPWQLEGRGVSLETVKKAEKDDCLILRMVETLGCHSTGKLTIANTNAKLVETNLMEIDETGEIPCDMPVELDFKPFEIKTFKLKG